LPGKINDEPDEPDGNKDVQGKNEIVVGYPPGAYPAPDHNTDVGNKKCQDAENRKRIQYTLLIHIFGRFCSGGKEKDQVGHQHETSQVDQVTCFDEYGGYGPLAMNPKGFQDDDCNNVYQEKCCNKNEM
jgi:hypothetical protein